MFSIIVPVYNRPDEVEELLESLNNQTTKNFEVVLIEDGSQRPCKEVADRFRDKLEINYYAKENTGRSDSRNVGMKKAKGDFFVFFDSDCVIPPEYFTILTNALKNESFDCFGGPDAAHESFSILQKAISYAMTSFFTTGGIRGGKRQMEKFMPRTFNMGFKREVYDQIGGFKNMFGEDIDLSLRIRKAGFKVVLLHDAFVYHKRRVDLKKFYRQVNIFGKARISLYLLHPEALKLIHALPAFFTLGVVCLLLLSIVCSPLWLLPLLFYILLLFFDSLRVNRNLAIALLSVPVSFIQLIGYGMGFLQSFFEKVILRKGLEDIHYLKKHYK
ncbi:MAG: glycosyltransferase [Bacteroidales bacterium]|nr:glycosyltransferase [Bacteroidales bacterium]